MEGVLELAEEIFHLPVRLGLPRDSYWFSGYRSESYLFNSELDYYYMDFKSQQSNRAELTTNQGFKGFGQHDEKLVSRQFLRAFLEGAIEYVRINRYIYRKMRLLR